MPFLKIYLLIYPSYTLPSSAERRAGEDREKNGTTPRQQKVLFVNICHRHWLFSARGFPREFPLVPFRSPSSLLLCSAGSPKRSWRLGVRFALPPARIPPHPLKKSPQKRFLFVQVKKKLYLCRRILCWRAICFVKSVLQTHFGVGF